MLDTIFFIVGALTLFIIIFFMVMRIEYLEKQLTVEIEKLRKEYYLLKNKNDTKAGTQDERKRETRI